MILGLGWGAWHFPLFLVPGYNGSSGGIQGALLPFAIFVLATTAAAVVYTWLFNNTSGSVLLAVILHTSNNYLHFVIYPLMFEPMERSWLVDLQPAIGIVVVAAVLLACTRGRLSYRP